MEPSLIDVNIYCDESRYSNNEDPYLVIGAVKCLRDKKPEIANALFKMKRAYGIGGESMSYGIKQCAIRPWSVPSRAWKKLNRTNAFSSSLQIC